MIDTFVGKIEASATIEPLYLNLIIGNIANFDVKGMKLGSFTSQFAAFLLSLDSNSFFFEHHQSLDCFNFESDCLVLIWKELKSMPTNSVV